MADAPSELDTDEITEAAHRVEPPHRGEVPAAGPDGRATDRARVSERLAWLRIGIWLVAYLLACGLFVAARNRSIFSSVLAAFAVVGAGLGVDATISAHKVDPERSIWRRLAPSVALGAVGVVLLAVWWVGRSDGWGFFGLAIVYIAAGAAVERLRDDANIPTGAGPWLLGASATVALVGLLLMAVTGWSSTTVLAAVGLLTVPVGLSLVSEAASRFLRHRPWAVMGGIALAGAVLLAGGLLIAKSGMSDGYAVVLAVAVFVLVLAIAARSNADVVLVVAMAGVVWTLTARPVPMVGSVAPAEGASTLVVLGDSYISGEGADEYFEGTNQKGDNECRRAPTAYAARLVTERYDGAPARLAFLACSGADVDDVRGQLDEWADLAADSKPDAQLVLLSVGGNDALFGSIGQTCLLPGDCSELGPAWMAHLDEVESELRSLYREVRTAFAGDAAVAIVPYPSPLGPEWCQDLTLTASEYDFLNEFVKTLDDLVVRVAREESLNVVGPMRNSLAGHRLCEGDQDEWAVNFLAANGVGGTLEQSASPLNWFHNSLHPNPRGHDLMLAELVTWLADHQDLQPVTAPDGASAAEAPAARPGGDGRCVGETGDDMKACTSGWRVEQIGRFLLTTGWLVVVMAAGAWLLSLVVLRLWRLVFDDS